MFIRANDYASYGGNKLENFVYKKLKDGLFVMVTAPDNELETFTEMNNNRKSYETLLRTTMQNTGVSKILGMKRKKEIFFGRNGV